MIDLNLLRVSVIFCDHLQEGVFFEGYITKITNPLYSYKILSFQYVIHNMC